MLIGLHTLPQQVMGQMVGTFVQLPISQRTAAMHGSHCMRMQRSTALKQAMHELLAGVFTTGVVERGRQQRVFSLRQHR
ncbi:hypothetical protein Pta6605_28920 [Pseudomonas amygdali pv. tabaci]|nr:hypothetical protein Pta6605_28920 [Pseudomonas amygdali pv. tabaci]